MRKARRKLNILVTAGPTREPLDPVRFISNYSTGYLGCRIAREAKNRGHRVILIGAGSTAERLQREIKKKFSWCDCLIMTAAVCDFRAARVAKRKIKRSPKGLLLKLKPNPDILAGLAREKGRRMLVGVALETENLKRNAQAKLRQKQLDLIVATQMKANRCPFGAERLDALILDKRGRVRQLKRASKMRLARILLESIEKVAYPSS